MLRVNLKWAQSDPKATPKRPKATFICPQWFRNARRVTLKHPQSNPKVAQSDPRVPPYAQSHPNMNPESHSYTTFSLLWCLICFTSYLHRPKVTPMWCQNDAKMIPNPSRTLIKTHYNDKGKCVIIENWPLCTQADTITIPESSSYKSVPKVSSE